MEWLMGKLRFRWRCLISSQQELCTLLSKVIQAPRSSPSAPGCLSLWSISVTTVGPLECWACPNSGLYKQGRTLLYLSPGEQGVEALGDIVWCPLQPLPPVLLGRPEPSSVLSGYKWSLTVPAFS